MTGFSRGIPALAEKPIHHKKTPLERGLCNPYKKVD
jgi:hypothetical protein